MSQDHKNLTPKELEPIVENRMLVQAIALELLKLIRGREDFIANHVIHRRIVMLCVGAAFSLWRAVPLVHVNRRPLDNVLASGDYLEQIVRHNSITHKDDDKSRAWSFGFYLSNARYRIKEICSDEICREWPEGRRALESLGLREAVTEQRQMNYDAGDKIKESIMALRAIVDALKARSPNEVA
jgi:hypothetical protein